jgi:hypothetical protein
MVGHQQGIDFPHVIWLDLISAAIAADSRSPQTQQIEATGLVQLHRRIIVRFVIECFRVVDEVLVSIADASFEGFDMGRPVGDGGDPIVARRT